MSLRDASGSGPAEEASAAANTLFSGRVIAVRELARAIQKSLDGFGRLSVEGEVTQIKRAAAGHLYFDLKDLDAKISCAIWRSSLAAALRFDLKEGDKVVAHGRLDVYAPRGTFSLIVQRLEPRGIGELLAKLELLKTELAARGWFERRRALPSLPRVIGVVTSRDTAAFQDFLRTRSLRWPLYPVRFAHTPVQGAGAAADIAAAIRRMDQSGVDVIVVCRGGGSLEDLWCFNELAVAEAIWNTSVPVVTGVGHETDTTLADLVADHRAHTPTDAAQTVIPERRALENELERLSNFLDTAVEGVLEERERRLAEFARSRVLRDPHWILDERVERLEHAAHALRLSEGGMLERRATRVAAAAARLERQSPRVRLERAHARLEAIGTRVLASLNDPLARAEQRAELAAATLQATSPFRVLERGYSITRRADGTLLRSAAALAPGDALETVLHEGSVRSRVESTQQRTESPQEKARPA